MILAFFPLQFKYWAFLSDHVWAMGSDCSVLNIGESFSYQRSVDVEKVCEHHLHHRRGFLIYYKFLSPGMFDPNKFLQLERDVPIMNHQSIHACFPNIKWWGIGILHPYQQTWHRFYFIFKKLSAYMINMISRRNVESLNITIKMACYWKITWLLVWLFWKKV